MNIGNRLISLASLVEDNTKVFDIGCDHGLLSIYLSKTHDVVATDISSSSITKTKENIEKYNALNIEVYLTDGLNNLDIKKEDTIIIAGMGTSTILKILKANKHILSDTLIIQSNKNHSELRKEVCSLGYYMDKEIIYIDNYLYVMIRFKKGYKKYSEIDYLVGISNNKDYLTRLLKRYTKLYDNIPDNQLKRKKNVNKIIKQIKTLVDSN